MVTLSVDDARSDNAFDPLPNQTVAVMVSDCDSSSTLVKTERFRTSSFNMGNSASGFVKWEWRINACNAHILQKGEGIWRRTYRGFYCVRPSIFGGTAYETTEDNWPTCRSGSGNGGSNSGTCFLADSRVTLADLSTKPIAEIQVGDSVLGNNGMVNEVIALRIHEQRERIIYSINDLKTTEAHPLLTEAGWKAIDGEKAMLKHPEMEISDLSIGDKLVHIDLSSNRYSETVTSITQQTMDVAVYNLDVSGNDTYVVDEVVVHNK